MKTTDIGRGAEAAVANYLTSQGFSILDRNWRTRWCEIDIVAKKRSVIYFIEVKYRADSGQGTGIEYLTSQKRRQMEFAVQFWCAQERWEGDSRLAGVEVTGPDFSNIDLVEI